MSNPRLALWAALLGSWLTPTCANAACCYFSAKNADILQPAQKVFLTWDPVKHMESFTVQPKFEGNALDFGMVIPTPTQPKLHEMPRDFFKHLAIFTILYKQPVGKKKAKGGGKSVEEDKSTPGVIIKEVGVVGSLDYKIIEATRADALFTWLKANKYSYSGDEATLNFYVQKKWFFTVMKIDTMQMKKTKDGTYEGEVTPTRFQFTSDKLVYPLKITQISVKDRTEALFYVQAPHKVDLQGDFTYQYQWVPMLQASQQSKFGKVMKLPGKGAEWLQAIENQIPALLQRANGLGFTFQPNQRPQPNRVGRVPTTMEWAKRLTDLDIGVLKGTAPYRYREVLNKNTGKMIKIGLNRAAPKEEVDQLQQLTGHLQVGAFITKFRKIFTREEMADDLVIVPARVGEHEDTSEYEQVLGSSPP